MILSNYSKLEYEVGKSAFKRKFDETMKPCEDRVTVKEETAFTTLPRRNPRKHLKTNGNNPVEDGNISCCARSGFTYHWIKQAGTGPRRRHI